MTSVIRSCPPTLPFCQQGRTRHAAGSAAHLDVARSGDKYTPSVTRPQWFHEQRQRLDVTVRDLPLALLLLTASLIPSLHGSGTRIGNVAERPVDTLGVAVAALQCLPLVVRTEAARYLTAAPDRFDTTSGAVTDTGRAITDLRHLLDVLDPGHTGPASESDGGLLPVVEQTRWAGQPVEFTEEGTPGSAGGRVGLVAHRVVQEAPTNALKCAYGSRTTVRVCHRPEEIIVDVTNGSTGTSTASPGGSRRGLTGLREGVEAPGGEFAAGPYSNGGFAVHTRIPAQVPVGEQV